MDKPITFTFWLFALMSPLTSIGIVLTLLVIANIAIGSYAFYVKMETIDSKKIKQVLVKLGIYLIIVILTNLLEKYMFNQVPLLKIATGFIAINELQSIASHYKKIYRISPFKGLTNWFNRLLRKKSAKPSSEETHEKIKKVK